MNYRLTVDEWKYHFERILVNKTRNSGEFTGNQNLEKNVGESWTRILKGPHNSMTLLFNVLSDSLSLNILIN